MRAELDGIRLFGPVTLLGHAICVVLCVMDVVNNCTSYMHELL